MSFISALISSAKENMHLHLTLKNGETLEGDIIGIEKESILIKNKEGLSGISFEMLGAWQLSQKGELHSQSTLKDHLALRPASETEKGEEVSQEKLAAFLEGFSPQNCGLSDISPQEPITGLPEPFQSGVNPNDRKKWDSLLSRYNNAEENPKILEALSEEMLSLGKRYPDTGVFFYNAACFKLKSYAYPDAGRLFEKAFECEQKSPSLYNAAYAYLHEACNSKALLNLGTYFCMKDPRSGLEMWYKFCELIREEKEYSVFSYVLREILFNFFILEAESEDLLKLLLQSMVYVFKPETLLGKEIAKLFQVIKENSGVLTSELVSHSLDRFEEFLNKKGLQKPNKAFDSRISLLSRKGKEAKIEPLKACGASKEEDEEDEEDEKILEASQKASAGLSAQISAPEASAKRVFTVNLPEDELASSETYTKDLKMGEIYRTIPPNKYGFLKDIEGREYHFKYENIFGNLGYLDSVGAYNFLPALFKSKPSELEDAATEETAYLIFSTDLLDNILSLAQNFAKERDYPHAILELKTLLKYVPEHPEALKYLKKWEKLYRKKYKGEAKNSKINLEPKNEAEWRQRAAFLLELNMFEEAIEAFSHVKAGVSSSFYGQGLAYLKTGRYEEAQKAFSKALENNSVHYHAAYAQGLAFQRSGAYEKALEAYKKVIALRPDYRAAWKQKAFVLSQLGKYENALKAYDMSLALEPQDWTALSLKSSCLIKLNRLSEAKKGIDEALNHRPAHPDSLFTKGYILQKEKRFEEALIYFDKSLKLDSENVKALSKKAYVLANLGRNAAAAELIEKAIQLNLKNPKSWYYKGVVFHYAGEYAQAVLAYRKALALKPGVERVLLCKEKAEKKLGPLLTSDLKGREPKEFSEPEIK